MPRGQHAAGDDRNVAGAGHGGLCRPVVRRVGGMDGGGRFVQSLSGTYGLRLATQPALALAPTAAAPARVLLRGERTRRGAARWTLHFAKPAPRGVGLVLAIALLVGVAVVGAERGGEYRRRSPRAKAASATMSRARSASASPRSPFPASRRSASARSSRLPASAPNRRCRSSTRSRRARISRRCR